MCPQDYVPRFAQSRKMRSISSRFCGPPAAWNRSFSTQHRIQSNGDRSISTGKNAGPVSIAPVNGSSTLQPGLSIVEIRTPRSCSQSPSQLERYQLCNCSIVLVCMCFPGKAGGLNLVPMTSIVRGRGSGRTNAQPPTPDLAPHPHPPPPEPARSGPRGCSHLPFKGKGVPGETAEVSPASGDISRQGRGPSITEAGVRDVARLLPARPSRRFPL